MTWKDKIKLTLGGLDSLLIKETKDAFIITDKEQNIAQLSIETSSDGRTLLWAAFFRIQKNELGVVLGGSEIEADYAPTKKNNTNFIYNGFVVDDLCLEYTETNWNEFKTFIEIPLFTGWTEK